MSFLGPLVPLFWISGDVSSGFQSQSGFCLIRYFCGGRCNVHSPRFTSGATLGGRHAAGHFPTCMCRGGTWLRFERAIARTEDERATIVPATRLHLTYHLQIFPKVWTMISNFQFIPYFIILQNFAKKCEKQKKTNFYTELNVIYKNYT